MVTLRQLASDAGIARDDAAVVRLREVFVAGLRAHGRSHHRGLLAAMRRHLGEGATERGQEIAMLFRRKLRLRAPTVRDLASVREALGTKGDAM